MFCYQIRKSIGSMAAVLGGVDLLTFTGGIGEHAAPIRAEICSGLKYLGIILNEEANRSNKTRISSTKSSCEIRVLESNEDLQIARHCQALSIKTPVISGAAEFVFKQ
jgi:acetate kinase